MTSEFFLAMYSSEKERLPRQVGTLHDWFSDHKSMIIRTMVIALTTVIMG
jgi:hypothetical protein